MRTAKYLFVKWFIIFAAIIAISVIAAKLGLFTFVVSVDISHLSSIIACLFVIFTGMAGKLCYDLSSIKYTSKISYKRKMRVLRFMASSFFTMGLLGTIIGFCYMMHGTLKTDLDVTTIITQLKIGASTKLYATLSGIVSSLLLQLQILVIENEYIEEEYGINEER